MSDRHCSAEDIAAFLDNGLSWPERRVVDTHLAECSACRAELVATHALLSSRDTKRGFHAAAPVWWLGAAAALVLLLIPVTRRTAPILSTEHPTMRSVGIEGSSLRAISPRDQSLPFGAGRLVWSDAGDATYRVIITDSTGASVWTVTTRDTSITIPADRRFVRRQRYYWSVDALKLDGSSYTSGAVPFSVRE